MHRSNSVLAVKTGPKTKNILLDAGPKSGALGIWGPYAVAQPAQAPGRPWLLLGMHIYETAKFALPRDLKHRPVHVARRQ